MTNPLPRDLNSVVFSPSGSRGFNNRLVLPSFGSRNSPILVTWSIALSIPVVTSLTVQNQYTRYLGTLETHSYSDDALGFQVSQGAKKNGR